MIYMLRRAGLFFFKQKTAYEMRISDWSSDVCSSDLRIALSMYNTGSQSRGFSNGYVGRVVGNAGVSDGIQPAAVRIGEPMPATDTSAGSSAAAQLAALVEENTSPAGPPKAMPAPPPPSWDVFARAEYERARLAEEGENR